MNPQLFLDLIEQVEGGLSIPVHFIDENDHRSVSHPANLHELSGLFFHSFHRINHEDDAVHGRKCPVGILRKVFVARGVQQVDECSTVFKTHNGSGDTDSTLALYLHEITGRVLLDLVAFDGSCRLDGATEEQEFFRQCGFTGIRVGNDGEGASLLDFSIEFHEFGDPALFCRRAAKVRFVSRTSQVKGVSIPTLFASNVVI